MDGKYDKILKGLNITFKELENTKCESPGYSMPAGMLSEIADFKESIFELREKRYREGLYDVSKVREELSKEKNASLVLKGEIDSLNSKLEAEKRKNINLSQNLKEKDEINMHLTEELKFLKSEVQVYILESKRQGEISKECENLIELQKNKNELMSLKMKSLTSENCFLLSKLKEAKFKKVRKEKSGSLLSFIKGVMRIF